MHLTLTIHACTQFISQLTKIRKCSSLQDFISNTYLGRKSCRYAQHFWDCWCLLWYYPNMQYFPVTNCTNHIIVLSESKNNHW